MVKRILCIFACLLFVLSGAALALDDVQMLPTRKRVDSEKSRQMGNTTVEQSEIVYVVAVTSRAFKELQGVTVKYNIFYENAELGSTAKPEVKMAKGSETIASLLTNKPVEFETKPIKLEKAALDGNWYFGNGASSRARDRVVGVWLKAFDATGKQIGEYKNPPSVSTKQAWKD